MLSKPLKFLVLTNKLYFVSLNADNEIGLLIYFYLFFIWNQYKAYGIHPSKKYAIKFVLRFWHKI